MAQKKKTKDSSIYQWSGDIRRIIPMGGGLYARVTNELGKSTNYERDSEAFRTECKRLDEIMNGKITRELEELGW